jgi:isoleucyl-tRNA synthetase
MYPEIGGEKRQRELEERVLERWREKRIFARALERRAGAKRFAFYEGPPTANGRPGIHHVLSRTFKDVICRYRDLAGFHVERKAGWDTHGLPVEVEVEKKLGIHGKEAIQAYGLEGFTKGCIDSVFQYVSDWEKLTERIGYWLDLDNAYVTYHESYVESVWWSLAELFKKGLLYQDHKVIWWWPQGGTALSAQEVGLGYREAADPSVTVRFKLLGDDLCGRPVSALAWTTTPWTLPSNVALAVGPELEYSLCEVGTEVLLLASALKDAVLKKHPHTVLKALKGSDLVGKRYEPLFAFETPAGGRAHEIIAGDFVATDTGTGLVHCAPAFGVDDHRVCKASGIGFLQLVTPDGKMSPSCGAFAGMYFKDADKEILKDLKARGIVFEHSQYKHDYPFCWRAQNDPLIQYARPCWFIRTTAVKDKLLSNNAKIHWHPEHIQEGRFGDFLRNNVDWALSRERFWGTPLPIWVNDVSGKQECLGSVAEIEARNPQAFAPFEAARAQDPSLSPHLRVHKPWIDQVTYTKPGEPGVYRRVKDVIDCWYDSGAMPFAQRHYPFENKELFEQSFPADYICEAIDQTRGWFYSLLAISTLLFDQEPYRHVIVNGHINDKHGKKMSKSLGNTVNPWDVINVHGVDPLRWYMLTINAPWQSKSFDIDDVADIERKVFGTLWPSFNFFALYANVEKWKPGTAATPHAKRPATDRWILSRLHTLIGDYRAAMDDFDPMKAARAIGAFIGDELSNWYIRRNRARFWKATDKLDQSAAFDTLHTALETIAFLLAPIAPLTADQLYLALHPEGGLDSVHLGDLPQQDRSLIDAGLERRMGAILEVVSLGRAARETAKLKIRQPLSRLIASGPDKEALQGLLDESLAREVKDELNVKELVVAERSGEYCTVTIKPNLPVLGPKLGKNLGKVKGALGALTEAQLATFETTGKLALSIDGAALELGEGELLVERSGREGFAVAAAHGYMAALDTALTPDLISEGLARELINRIQNQRKTTGLEVSDRIALEISGPAPIEEAAKRFQDRIAAEVLATRVAIGTIAGDAKDHDVEGHAVRIALRKTPSE